MPDRVSHRHACVPLRRSGIIGRPGRQESLGHCCVYGIPHPVPKRKGHFCCPYCLSGCPCAPCPFHFFGRRKGGDLVAALEDLCKTGFVTRDYTWNLQGTIDSKLSRYRLSDNYVRFYLRCVLPIRKKIQSGLVGELPPAWTSLMGLQFENLVLNKKNRLRIFAQLGIPLHEIILSNPSNAPPQMNRILVVLTWMYSC